ncbi:MAG: Na+:solute symporter [Bacteroidetes bacterium]|nr:Na+:solute symporter [Bacteroidota bacterium]
MNERLLSTLDWVMIGSFLLLSLIIGLVYSKRAGKSTEEYFLSGRKLPWWIAGTAMVATTFAADTPLAVTELVARDGISGNWLWWSMAIGGMMTVFFFAPLWRRAGVLTDLEFTELRYDGPAAAFLRGFRAVYLGLFMNAVIIGWVNLAMVKIVTVVLPGLSPEGFILGAMVFVAIYSSLSGQWGVAVTDTFQFVLAMTGCVVLAWFALDHPSIGGIEGLQSNLLSSTFEMVPRITDTSVSGVLSLSLAAFFTYIGVIWWSSWYPGNEPGGGGYIAQRMMSAKNETHALVSTLWFNIAHYCLRPWPWILVALVSLVMFPGLPESDQGKGFVMVMKEVLPSGWYGFLLAAFLAAYMSTISTHLNWGASYVVNDMLKRFVVPNKSDRRLVWYSRLVTVVIMLISFWMTFNVMSTIAGAWQFIIDCGAGMGLVLILRWYWWRINAWSELAAMLTPLVVYPILTLGFQLEFPYTTLVTTAVTTLSWILVTLISPPVNHQHLTAFYRKTRPLGPGWTRFRNELNLEGVGIPLSRLFKLWILGITVIYGTLFAIACFIFNRYDLAIAFTGLVGVAAGLLKMDYDSHGWSFWDQ